MNTPGMSPGKCTGVLALAFLAASCAQRPLRPEPLRFRRTTPAVAPEPTTEVSFSLSSNTPRLSPELTYQAPIRRRTPRAILATSMDETQATQGLEFAQASANESAEARDLEPASPTEPQPDSAPSETDLFDLHGKVASFATGPPSPTVAPWVVLAMPAGDSATELEAMAELSALQPPLMISNRHEGAVAPSFLVTSPGREVHFENRDSICHSYFSSSEPNAFDLGMLNPGEAKPVVFQHPGHVQIYCSLHAGKQMSLLVAPTPHHALVQADGSFVLAGLAPGEYQLEAWSDGRQSRRQRVTIGTELAQPFLLHLDPVQPGDVE